MLTLFNFYIKTKLIVTTATSYIVCSTGPAWCSQRTHLQPSSCLSLVCSEISYVLSLKLRLLCVGTAIRAYPVSLERRFSSSCYLHRHYCTHFRFSLHPTMSAVPVYFLFTPRPRWRTRRLLLYVTPAQVVTVSFPVTRSTSLFCSKVEPCPVKLLSSWLLLVSFAFLASWYLTAIGNHRKLHPARSRR